MENANPNVHIESGNRISEIRKNIPTLAEHHVHIATFLTWSQAVDKYPRFIEVINVIASSLGEPNIVPENESSEVVLTIGMESALGIIETSDSPEHILRAIDAFFFGQFSIDVTMNAIKYGGEKSREMWAKYKNEYRLMYYEKLKPAILTWATDKVAS